MFFLTWQPRGLAVLRGGHELHCCFAGQRYPQIEGIGNKTEQCRRRLQCRSCRSPGHNSVSHTRTVIEVTLREREGRRFQISPARLRIVKELNVLLRCVTNLTQREHEMLAGCSPRRTFLFHSGSESALLSGSRALVPEERWPSTGINIFATPL